MGKSKKTRLKFGNGGPIPQPFVVYFRIVKNGDEIKAPEEKARRTLYDAAHNYLADIAFKMGKTDYTFEDGKIIQKGINGEQYEWYIVDES